MVAKQSIDLKGAESCDSVCMVCHIMLCAMHFKR
jgi:hypothetical protein